MTALTTRRFVDRRTASTAFPALHDAKGRMFGVNVLSYEVEYVALPADATGGYCQAPGFFYGAEVQQMRAGRCYGASQRGKEFTTASERDAYIAKRMAAVEAYCSQQAA